MQKLLMWARRWWLGLIPLAVMWAIAARVWTNPFPKEPWKDPLPVEADLYARSAATLKDTVLDEPQITVFGRDVRLKAKAFSEEGRRDALAAVGGVPGVRLVDGRLTDLVPKVEPFVWTAVRDVQVTLWDNAPLPVVKSRLMDAARKNLPGVEVTDKMKFARGAPPRFENAALLLLDQISKLEKGTIRISGASITLSGMARELGDREAIAAALKDLPEGFSVAANEIKAPPYIFRVYKDPVAATVRLDGNVPDDTVQARIETAVSLKFLDEGKNVKKDLKTSPGAPPSFGNAVVAALGALSRLSTGTLVVSDNEVKLSGDALFESAAVDIRAGLGKDFPKNWQYTPEISVKPPAGPVDAPVCQQLFSELLTKGNVRFETSRADINPDSAGLLDRLVETALRCPSGSIEVAGHTDSDGDDSFNQALSEKRAQAVVDYLVKAGVSADRLTAVGYGRTQPVGSNDTQEGKAQNRRIEFLVK